MPISSAYPEPIQKAIAYLSHLPGIGNRSAERMVLSMMSWKPEELEGFGAVVTALGHNVGLCPICGNYTEVGTTCKICSSEGRQQEIICVVEQVPQLHIIEKSGSYRGMYHVLGGKLSPMNGKGPNDLRIEELARRLENKTVKELLIALSPDIEGEATANYLAQLFARPGLTISRIAAGVPIGADLTFADSATLATAISGRRIIKNPAY